MFDPLTGDFSTTSRRNWTLDMIPQHRIALYLVYEPRIQRALDETVAASNFHKMRTEGNLSPMVYELSSEFYL